MLYCWQHSAYLCSKTGYNIQIGNEFFVNNDIYYSYTKALLPNSATSTHIHIDKQLGGFHYKASYLP